MDADRWWEEAEARAVVFKRLMKASLIQQAAMRFDPLGFLAMAEDEIDKSLAPALLDIRGMDLEQTRRELKSAFDAVLPEVIEHFRTRMSEWQSP